MNIPELFLIAVGLSMDAFAVSVCKGLAMQKVTLTRMMTVGIWFGGFQSLMTVIGYLLGSVFDRYIIAVDHWIAFIFLLFIGLNMIHESFSESNNSDGSLSILTMLVLSVAVSIDALAVGITFGLLPDINVSFAVMLIGVATFILSALGTKAGSLFGTKYKSKAEFSGGAVLIFIGSKILFQHLSS